MAAVSIAMKSATQSPDDLTELLWQDALRHLVSTNNEVLLPTNVVDIIGQANVEKIKSRLSAILRGPVVCFVDESINALRVLRTPAFSGSSISVASHARGLDSRAGEAPARPKPTSMKSAKVPRPPNAFILYRQHHHPRVKESYPDLTNNQISVILGKQWREETEEVKLHFKNLAEDFKKKHAEEHPDYQYTPRKPSEKKRRATSRLSPKSSKPSVPLETPPPMSASSPNAFTPPMCPDIQTGQLAGAVYMGQLEGPNVIFNASGLTEEPTSFGTNAFDSLFQQGQSEYDRTALFSQLELADGSFGDSFEFPDFAADYF
ncbi:HMG-box domain-containing protein [Aspergillus mulundensis]|uniref:MAT2 protein n=1 Tax=Aspergillus mulundensis TaxID=1810919 RepID=A0A3D8SIM3_9EURO|nr:MAT2 protein [Aspergillus mulundensis]RDW86143.1 MAT2 protein [Aspergillus mulundensis]